MPLPCCQLSVVFPKFRPFRSRPAFRNVPPGGHYVRYGIKNFSPPFFNITVRNAICKHYNSHVTPQFSRTKHNSLLSDIAVLTSALLDLGMSVCRKIMAVLYRIDLGRFHPEGSVRFVCMHVQWKQSPVPPVLEFKVRSICI